MSCPVDPEQSFPQKLGTCVSCVQPANQKPDLRQALRALVAKARRAGPAQLRLMTIVCTWPASWLAGCMAAPGFLAARLPACAAAGLQARPPTHLPACVPALQTASLLPPARQPASLPARQPALKSASPQARKPASLQHNKRTLYV